MPNQHRIKNGLFSELDQSIFKAFENLPSIMNIEKTKIDSIFTFEFTYPDEVIKVIDILNITRSCQMYDTSAKVMKINKDLFANFITDH